MTPLDIFRHVGRDLDHVLGKLRKEIDLSREFDLGDDDGSVSLSFKKDEADDLLYALTRAIACLLYAAKPDAHSSTATKEMYADQEGA